MIHITHQCMKIKEVNLVNVNLVTNSRASRHCSTQNLLKKFVQSIHTFVNGFGDTFMDNSNIAMLNMELRK